MTSSFRTKPIPAKKYNNFATGFDLQLDSNEKSKSLNDHSDPFSPKINLIVKRRPNDRYLNVDSTRVCLPYNRINRVELDGVEDYVRSAAIEIKEKVNKQKALEMYVGEWRRNVLGTAIRHKQGINNYTLTPTKKKSEFRLSGWEDEEVGGGGFEGLQ